MVREQRKVSSGEKSQGIISRIVLNYDVLTTLLNEVM